MRTPFVVLCAATLACGGDDSVSNTDDSGTGCEAASTCALDAQQQQDGADSSPVPKCGTGGWVTYGHDGARTFASDACITGPLSPAFTYSPAPPSGHTVNAVYHALATSDGVYLQWAASDGGYVGTTAADRVSLTGSRVWTFDSGSDANFGNWASISTAVTVEGGTLQSLVINDDGVYSPDITTGKSNAGTGVDWWGQSIPDPTGGVWFSDTSKSDGPGLFVGELDLTDKILWKQNEQGTMCGDGLSDKMGGIALDGGLLFYAPLYATGSAVKPTFKSGLYAYDAMSGTPKWNVPLTPASVISAGNGLVYEIEANALVARSQKDGSQSWTKPLPGAGAQAPVLANGLVIAAGSSGVSAFDAKSGAAAWSTPLSGAAAAAYSSGISNGCSGSQDLGAAVATSMAAAVPSGTLVVTASDGIHVLSLATGEDKWHGAVAGATSAVHDPVLVGNMVYVVDSPPGGFGYGPGKLVALKGS